jgi:hypothetical protein
VAAVAVVCEPLFEIAIHHLLGLGVEKKMKSLVVSNHYKTYE